MALEVEGVGKVYPPKTWLPAFGRKRPSKSPGVVALDRIEFTVRKGETVGLLGPNGAGKTTLLKILTTLILPTSGRVLLNGHDISNDPRLARQQLGLVTCDERSFYWRLSGRHNLEFFAALYGVPKDLARARAEELFETMGLAYAADRPFASYSSGMKQKLAIARGLIAQPSIVFYDEPTRSLDPMSCQAIRRWIVAHREKNPNQTHVIATNQMDEAEQLCDSVLIISHGRLIARGTMSEIRRQWYSHGEESHQIVYSTPRGSLHSIPTLDGIQIVEDRRGEESSSLTIRSVRGSSALSDILRILLDDGCNIISCVTHEPPFEDVFCSLVEQSRESPPVVVAEGVR
jgi:ABC-2 type transport system ATP-binding protein